MKDRARQVVTTNVADARAVLQQLLDLEGQVETAAAIIAEALLSGHKLLACGNGGSAADASHLTTEFVARYDRERRAYPAISLASHGGDLTAIGNDYSFADLFARQVQAHGKPGDVLALFTTSGNSENIFRALVAARDLKLKTVAFLGRDGGECAGLADVELLVGGKITARIQEGHKFLLHTICELVEEQLADAG
ncbi:MAG TPA: SIS domain-containing protein [Acidobacteriaceae bacterium]|nr:SIS domain-containing protein [Acidobacteriaceae bacterium]